jgi:regulatory protein
MRVLKPQLSLKARALRYLSQREHSRLELERKLARYVTENDDLESLLNQLEQANLLSQQRFSESLVRRRSARFGNQRIFAELQSHGLDDRQLTEIKVGLTDSEVERALVVLNRKFPDLPKDAIERAKQWRFLLQRGFSPQAIKAAFAARQISADDFQDDKF